MQHGCWHGNPGQVPDYRIDLKHTLRSISDECVELISNTVNTEEVVLHLKDGYDYAIFSGFGGEIVKDDVLAAAPPLIHVHAGDLPQFRGSTTFYYSILLNSSILGVSSIFLDQNIDTGKILSKRSFPLPPPNLDIDYYYDPMMRSACLIQTLTEINTELLLPVDNPFPQDSEYYFIMHPLLRHVAINKIKGVQTLKIFE